MNTWPRLEPSIPDDPQRTAGYDELPLDDYVDETRREHDADSVNDMTFLQEIDDEA